ncbi:SPOR domain-containing protein, partial [uncultured Maribacter sp.]|uniref:SPOR domain-containing protein n=1 Tax=uncultured Maribacter sp. TaxID=431308 RepID=UPI0030EE9A16
MRSVFNLFFLVFVLFAQAQNFGDNIEADLSQEKEYGTRMISDFEEEDKKEFQKAAEAIPVPYRAFNKVENTENGYYVISGTFSKSKNLKSQVRKLNKKGFNAGYFQNPENQLYYVYLNHYDSWRDALNDCSSKFGGRYEDQVWVLKILDGETESLLNTETVPVEDVTYDMLKETTTVNTESKTKLVKRADEYFDKMWYAEAARLYEQALSKGEKSYSYDVLKKAGDAHYFNTDMENAYKWYNILYTKYESNMGSDYLFKYAHSLKGIGNYKRSKRLLKLYNRKLVGEEVAKQTKQNEIVLDGLLRMEGKFDIANLSINSKYSEFSPMYYGGDQMVFASAKDSSIFNTRRYKWNNQPYLDLFVAKVNDETQDFKNALKFSKKINTKYHEASVAFSPDNETMYFTRNNYGKKLKRDKNGINHLKIYRSRKVNGEWLEAEEVSFNSDEYSTGHPALSPDGKQLYFVSDMP